jgi:hypothetical protein
MCRDCTRQYCTWIVANISELPVIHASQLKISSYPAHTLSSTTFAPRISSSTTEATSSTLSPGLGPRSRAEIPSDFLIAPPAAKPRGYGYGGYL